jgi:hypothetical protein
VDGGNRRGCRRPRIGSPLHRHVRAPCRFCLQRPAWWRWAGPLSARKVRQLFVPRRDRGSALLSWSLALGLGLAAFRLWRRPDQPLVPLRAKGDAASESTGSKALRALGRHPFFVGLGTAILPCGALAAAVLIAASTGAPALGALSMLAFAMVSGVGLVGAAWLFERFSRRPRPATSRILAVALALGALMFVIRPVHALRHGDPAAACHAPSHEGSAPAEPTADEHHHHDAP